MNEVAAEDSLILLCVLIYCLHKRNSFAEMSVVYCSKQPHLSVLVRLMYNSNVFVVVIRLHSVAFVFISAC